MSQLLIQQYLNQLKDLRTVSGTQRESVVREAFKYDGCGVCDGCGVWLSFLYSSLIDTAAFSGSESKASKNWTRQRIWRQMRGACEQRAQIVHSSSFEGCLKGIACY